MCMSHFKLFWIVTPSNFINVTHIRSIELRQTEVWGTCMLRFKLSQYDIILACLGSTSLFLHQLDKSLRWFCIDDCSSYLITSPKVTCRSSTYFHRLQLPADASWTYTRNKMGPSLVPWGTPHEISRVEETLPWNLVFWVRLVRKLQTMGMMDLHTPNCMSLLITILWLTRSKAFVKSQYSGVSWPSGLACRAQVLVLAAEGGFQSFEGFQHLTAVDSGVWKLGW